MWSLASVLGYNTFLAYLRDCCSQQHRRRRCAATCRGASELGSLKSLTGLEKGASYVRDEEMERL